MAEEKEKILVQISDPWGNKSFPIEWNKLPDDVLSEIGMENTVYAMSYSSSQPATYKSVVYFRVVKKFRKGIKEFDNGDVVFGV